MERIAGILVPADWDKDGNIVKLALATPTEEELLLEITSPDKEQALLRLIQQNIVIEGIRMKKGEKAARVFIVKNWQLKE